MMTWGPISRLIAGALALSCLGCAAPLQRAARPSPSIESDRPSPAISREIGRPTVGVAFGGGSARGIAHVGVIRWLEEHRIPVDVAAGTSMGGLVGGAFASGMDAAELQTFITSLDWDQLFGASTFAHKNIRRKADARAYPSRLEFGLRGGIVPPTALNSGEYVELLLGRIAAPYFDIDDFDDLPTPFRTVAVDLLSAQPVVMRRGSLADAMRSTMSLPLIFPPMEVDGHVLIDGGTMNNVPADIVKAMGADRVVAINVGDLSDREGVSSYDARRGRQYARRDDALVDAARPSLGGRRDQCPLAEVWIARLAARRRSDRRRLPCGRDDARPAAAARRQRDAVRCLAPRPPGASSYRTACARVHRGRGFWRE